MTGLKPRDIAITTALLAAFAGAGTGLVALVQSGTEARIEANRMEVNRQRIADLLGELDYVNEPVTDTTTLSHDDLGGTNLPAWFARDADDNVIGVVVSAIAPDGYSGDIHLLVGIDREGELLGVRVSEHRETPGLGDAIEAGRSDWIHDFEGRRLGDPPRDEWTVRRDGGAFDQFTGATITPRAVVHAVRRSLEYFEAHREELLATEPGEGAAVTEPLTPDDDQETTP
ncbi:electron transport complex protein RnfG [Thioalkalivibrio sp. ALE21]|uniref:electron transport complex subunit RsxG n=1 Tax=Thioalkalivibrio sp. ALE21 TaxID=1158175 RepID=UPI000D90089A|nr:electron transport complex subunit RsxG [Thioalkalivibrio sp. ALE21]PYG01232.1 electron transport complex protein RnfG [Thioalkalivibrio sp. ALE21]